MFECQKFQGLAVDRRTLFGQPNPVTGSIRFLVYFPPTAERALHAPCRCTDQVWVASPRRMGERGRDDNINMLILLNAKMMREKKCVKKKKRTRAYLRKKCLEGFIHDDLKKKKEHPKAVNEAISFLS